MADREYAVALHWRDGSVNQLHGRGATTLAAVTDAMRLAGYGAGALPALDYWEAIPMPQQGASHA